MVELLVTIAIISAVIGILLPAVQSARESARRAQCRNQLRQIALALLTYHNSHNKFPYGGWGFNWVGVPERGAGPRQPGGWVYSVLPYLEERDLYDLGMGQIGTAAFESYSQRLRMPLCLFVCPSRRLCSPWPIADQYSYARRPRPFGDVTVVARGDYAINGGTSHIINLGGPADLQQGDDVKYWQNAPNAGKFSGISHLRIAVAASSIADGTSKTYLIGEKHLNPVSYETGMSPGDNESLYAGYNTDLHRFAGVIESIKVGAPPYAQLLNDHATLDNNIAGSVRFGSAHSAGVNMAYCDGSVRFVEYDVGSDVHFRAGHRMDDGNPLESLD
jgi:prepilin-type processing-associated H-X9-DG protein